MKCNEKLTELMVITRPLLRQAVEDVNKLKLWSKHTWRLSRRFNALGLVTFLIPKIEDGNNFGVSIQVKPGMQQKHSLGTLQLTL